MSDPALESLYREVILDHYKNPRGHGVIEDADAEAEGQNPLCGDEVSVYVAFAEDGETIDDVKFSGRGCAISQAATSMLMEMTKGRTAEQVATLDKDELLAEIGVPLTPVRLKCAMLGLTTLKVALHKAKGTPLPDGLAGFDDLELTWACPRSRSLRQPSSRPARRRSSARGACSSASTTAAASCTRSRIAARTTTGRSAKATGTRISAGSS